MASKSNEKYELTGTASVGESITLTANSTVLFEETVPADFQAEILFKYFRQRV